MSFTITTDVFCDNCNDWIFGATGHKIDKARALQRAKELGWTVDNCKHVCPLCSGKAKLRLSSGEYVWKENK